MKRSVASIALAVFLGLLVLLVLGALGVRWRGAKARADELAALRASSKAVLPEDLTAVDVVRPEPAPWLARVVGVSLRRPWDPGALGEPGAFAAVRANARKGQFGPQAEAAFAALEACAGAQCADAVLRVAAIQETHDGIVDVPTCGLEAVRLMALGHADEVAVAREAAGFGPIDTREVVAQLEKSGAAMPNLPAVEVMALRTALQVEVLKASWSERPDEVMALLRAHRDVARVFERTPLAIAAMLTTSLDLGLLESLELALPRMPRESDFAWLEMELESIQPRARMALAAEGERAFANRMYEVARRGGTLSGMPAEKGFLSGLTESYDQGSFLQRTRESIERMGEPAFRRPPVDEPGWIGRKLAPKASYVAPAFDRMVGVADVLEARLVLARAALVAFRGGAQEALAMLPKLTDPFDGKPVRMAMGPDGVVVLWCVGQDGVDDGGRDDQRDVVWRFKLR